MACICSWHTSIEQHCRGPSAQWLRSPLSDPQGELGRLEQPVLSTYDLDGLALTVPIERETGLRDTKKLNQGHGPLEVGPGWVTYLLTFRPVFLPPDTGFPLLLKVLLLTRFFILIPQQGTALGFPLQESNVPIGLGLQRNPCLRVHGSSQNYSTYFLLPWTCPYLIPKLPDL